MKTGIIVHSHTGNTRGVAEILLQKLEDNGCTVEMRKVEAVNEDPKAGGPVKLKHVPDPDEFDFLIFAAPVRGFNLSPVMAAYLQEIPTLHHKKAACFVTEFFPFSYMGGRQAVDRMSKLLEAKEVSLLDSGIINWSRPTRDKQIRKLTDRLALLPVSSESSPEANNR
ncbi:flavodoxin family protein [Alkalicoccus saliphilus]|uniref:Flavodoxin n=1 Tax=Alkalicoccus saliphilus TaxID=200989 RepID=A0A2T4U222_9BACI|nr:flavodoxin [Alkalicoccus saliphilus]PTL37415.1 flavodoxin [Alkalicoccus saliphilus]